MKIKNKYEIAEFLTLLDNYKNLFNKKITQIKDDWKLKLNGVEKTDLWKLTNDFFELKDTNYIDQLWNDKNAIQKTIYLKNVEIEKYNYILIDGNFSDELSIYIKWYKYPIYIWSVINSTKIEKYKKENNKYIYNFIQKAINLWCYDNSCLFWDNIDYLVWKKISGYFILSSWMFGELDIRLDIFKPVKINY